MYFNKLSWNKELVINKLEESSINLLLTRSKKGIAKVDNQDIESDDSEEFLGLNINSKLTLETYINKLRKKPNQK